MPIGVSFTSLSKYLVIGVDKRIVSVSMVLFTIVQIYSDSDSVTLTNHHGSTRKVQNSGHVQGFMEAKKENDIKTIINKIVPFFVVIFSLSYFSFAIYCYLII